MGLYKLLTATARLFIPKSWLKGRLVSQDKPIDQEPVTETYRKISIKVAPQAQAIPVKGYRKREGSDFYIEDEKNNLHPASRYDSDLCIRHVIHEGVIYSDVAVLAIDAKQKKCLLKLQGYPVIEKDIEELTNKQKNALKKENTSLVIPVDYLQTHMQLQLFSRQDAENIFSLLDKTVSREVQDELTVSNQEQLALDMIFRPYGLGENEPIVFDLSLLRRENIESIPRLIEAVLNRPLTIFHELEKLNLRYGKAFLEIKQREDINELQRKVTLYETRDDFHDKETALIKMLKGTEKILVMYDGHTGKFQFYKIFGNPNFGYKINVTRFEIEPLSDFKYTICETSEIAQIANSYFTQSDNSQSNDSRIQECHLGDIVKEIDDFLESSSRSDRRVFITNESAAALMFNMGAKAFEKFIDLTREHIKSKT